MRVGIGLCSFDHWVPYLNIFTDVASQFWLYSAVFHEFHPFTLFVESARIFDLEAYGFF